MNDKRKRNGVRSPRSLPTPGRAVLITSRDNGEKTSAELLNCPDCKGEAFCVYIPAGMDHVHFQCLGCSTTLCDGCTKEDGRGQ